MDGASFAQAIEEAYAEVVHWRRNIFSVPSGAEGKEFVREQARLFNACAESSALEPIAVRAVMTMPALLLQKPHRRSKARDHRDCLRRRLLVWKFGNIAALVDEGRTIQQHLPISHSAPGGTDSTLSRRFAKLIFEGKTKAALRLLSRSSDNSRVLPLDDIVEEETTVSEILKKKHPEGHPSSPHTLLPPNSQSEDHPHPILFDQLNGDRIRAAALRTQGGAGPSFIDACGWRHVYFISFCF